MENNRYDNVIKRICGLSKVNNYGISGTRIAHQRVASANPRLDLCFCGRSFDMDKDADIIVVFGGTNDYGHGDVPFGSLTDGTPNTYCGAVDFLMRALKENYNAKILFMTPARRVGCSKPSCDERKADDAKPLIDYVEVIEQKGKQYDIPVLNLYRELGIDPNNDEDREKYANDGLHFNDDGHAAIATKLIEYLKEL